MENRKDQEGHSDPETQDRKGRPKDRNVTFNEDNNRGNSQDASDDEYNRRDRGYLNSGICNCQHQPG